MDAGSIRQPLKSIPYGAPRVGVTFEVDTQSMPATDQVTLKGSFDPETGAFDPQWNQGRGLAMRDDGKGGDRKAGDQIYSATVNLKGTLGTEFWWGATDAQGRYLVSRESDPKLVLGDQTEQVVRLTPVRLHRYGLQETDGQASVRAWSPSAQSMAVELFDPHGQKISEVPMTHPVIGNSELATGVKPSVHSTDWVADLGGSKADLDGYTYLLKETDAQGRETTYIDPFARHLLGQQRGLERIFVDPVGRFETGWYDDSGKGGPNYADNPQMARFSVDGRQGADAMYLVLKDDKGHPLSKESLQKRLGALPFKSYDEASTKDRRDFDVLKSWQLQDSPPIDPYLVSAQIDELGRIPLKRVSEATGDGGWVGVVHNFDALKGLQYEFQAEANGKLVADLNGDGSLSKSELARTPYNDPENIISERPGSSRRARIVAHDYEPRHARSERLEADPKKQVIYEAHVGSFLAAKDNALSATFEDMVERLDYVVGLGATAIELMPTSEFGGKKDWGYTNDHYFAGADGYGFSMPAAKARDEGLIARDDPRPPNEEIRIDGTDALKWFIDKAHERGLNVYGDVVYNHTSGKPDGDNPLHSIGGENSDFFRWADGTFKETPWGRKPDYAESFVKDFFADNAVAQVLEMGYDGLRFDFTQVLHNTGDSWEKTEGMNTLRQVQRELELVKPGIFTVAEDFSRDPLVASPLDWSRSADGLTKRGMGFDAVWNDHYRDAIYGMLEGASGAPDKLIEAMTSHAGVPGTGQMLTYSHSHDEVGNSGKWAGRLAAHTKSDEGVFSATARSKARSAAALTLLGPGIPMIWQGEEFMANNDFKHGLTSTWGADTDWLDGTQAEKSTPKAQARQGQVEAYRDLIALRRSSDAFLPDAPVRRVYTHNDDRIAAFERQGSQGQAYVVITSMGDTDRSGYPISLPEGNWKEVFSTDAVKYGGSGLGQEGSLVSGQANLSLPAGATIVLKKVDEVL